jgi:hypothetical protein
MLGPRRNREKEAQKTGQEVQRFQGSNVTTPEMD